MIIGKLIPAATGLKRYRNVEVKPSDKVSVGAVRPQTEEQLLAALRGNRLGQRVIVFWTHYSRASPCTGNGGDGRSSLEADEVPEVDSPLVKLDSLRQQWARGAPESALRLSRGPMTALLWQASARRRVCVLDRLQGSWRLRGTVLTHEAKKPIELRYAAIDSAWDHGRRVLVAFAVASP